MADRKKSIHQLDFEHRWLTAQQDHETYFRWRIELEATLRRSENLDPIIGSRSAAARVS